MAENRNKTFLQTFIEDPYWLHLQPGETSIDQLEFPAHGIYYHMLEVQPSHSAEQLAYLAQGIHFHDSNSQYRYTFAAFTFNLQDQTQPPVRQDLFSFATAGIVRSVRIMPEAVFVLNTGEGNKQLRHLCVYNYAGVKQLETQPDMTLVDVLPKNANAFASIHWPRRAIYADGTLEGYEIKGPGCLINCSFRDGQTQTKTIIKIPRVSLLDVSIEGASEDRLNIRELRNGKLWVNDDVVVDEINDLNKKPENKGLYRSFSCQMSNDAVMLFYGTGHYRLEGTGRVSFSEAIAALILPLCNGDVIQLCLDSTARLLDAELKEIERGKYTTDYKQFLYEPKDRCRVMPHPKNPQSWSDLLCTQSHEVPGVVRIFGNPFGFFRQCGEIYGKFRDKKIAEFFATLVQLPLGVWQIAFDYYFTDSDEYRRMVCAEMAAQKRLGR